MFIASLIVAAFIAVTGRTHAQQIQPPATQPHQDQTMKYQVLDQREDRLIVLLPNRMIVVAQALRTAPVVSTQVWVKTGSVYEQEHVGAGLSHFLEHLISGGTTSTRSEDQSNATLGLIGGRVNAATGLDTVHYYIDTTADHAAIAIDLISDWMQNSLITTAEYDRERQVIQREFESGQGSPGRIFWKLTQQARYQAHPARHPTIGYIDEFLAITRDEIYDFYKRMYVPNNMVFAVAGDIDPQQVVNQIAGLWGDVPDGELPELTLPIEPDLDQPTQLSGYAEINQPKLRLAWPGTKLGEEYDYALDLLAMALGQGESSRLVRTVRDQQQAVFTVSAYNASFPWGRGFVGVDADVRPLSAEDAVGLDPQQAILTAVERAKAKILEQVSQIRREGITDEELSRAKRKVLAQVVAGGQSAHDVASSAAHDLIAMGDPDYSDHYAQAIQDITPGQILAAASQYLDGQRLITVTLLPTPPDYEQQPLTRPVDAIDAADLASDPVLLDNIATVDRMHALATAAADDENQPVRLDPVQRYELPNGLRLLVQRNTQVPAVAMQMYSLGGLLADEPGREGVASAVASMSRKGTVNHTAEQIDQTLEDLGAQLGVRCGNNSGYIQAESLAEDWPTVLALMADVAIRPTFPDDEWARMQPRLVAAIRRQADSWSGQLDMVFRETYFGETHPWSQTTAGRAEVIEALTPQDLRDYHAAHLGAAETVLAVFGDVDPAEVARQVRTLFADMPEHAAVPFEPPSPPAPETSIEQVISRRPPAAVQIGFGPGITRRSPDFPALTVLTRILSSFPSGWLEGELRGAKGDGLAYAVWCYQITGAVPGSFVIGFNTSPPQVGDALGRTMSIVERARETLVDDETLARAKASVLVAEFLGKQTNSSRAADAALDALYDLPPDESERFMTAVRSLTADELQFAARMYLTNPVTVILTQEPVQLEGVGATVDADQSFE
jgi:zinc protease